MKNSMRSKLKRVIVRCLDWVEEFDIDPVIFDDVYMEAATQALEKRKDGEKFLVTVVMETYLKADEKKSQKHYVYNTYFVLINAGLHFKAEMMRLNFLKSHGIDLRKESLKGDDNGTESNNSFNPTEPSN
jgi:hypothetical protein